MRVISGRYKGRTLHAPAGVRTRPTLDRAREALFSILGYRVDNASVLDLFAGAGTLGIEALSRGARSAVFVENGRHPLDSLQRNLSAVKHPQVQVLALSVDRALKLLSRSGQRFDLVFMDPPYGLGLVPRTLLALVCRELLTDSGCIVAEHEARLHPANEYGSFLRTDLRRYGEIAFSIYSPITNIEGP